MTINDIGPAVIETLRDAEDLKDVASQLGDLAIDEVLDEGLARNIPVVELFRKLYKATASYSDYLLTKKLIQFLTGLSSVPLEQRRDQIARLDVDVEHRRILGENPMLLLDKLNDMRKPEMLSRAWKAYLQGKIDRTTLCALNHAIELVHVEDLPALRDLYRDQTSQEGLESSPIRPNQEIIEPPYHIKSIADLVDDSNWRRLVHLANCGLLDQVFGRGGAIGGRVGGLRRNALGRTFVELIIL